jgi:hypothetical protein
VKPAGFTGRRFEEDCDTFESMQPTTAVGANTRRHAHTARRHILSLAMKTLPSDDRAT